MRDEIFIKEIVDDLGKSLIVRIGLDLLRIGVKIFPIVGSEVMPVKAKSHVNNHVDEGFQIVCNLVRFERILETKTRHEWPGALGEQMHVSE